MNQDFNKIKASYKGHKSDIIPLLQDIQNKQGYLSEEMMQEVSRFVGVSKSEVFGVATFYSQFRFTPRGRKHVLVCKGTACHVSGANKILEGIERYLGIKEGEVTFDMEYSMESVGCLGCCALAPCAMVNKEIKSNLTLKDVKRIFSEKKNNV
jgi:NADH-quinone oxidoreductase subunit E